MVAFLCIYLVYNNHNSMEKTFHIVGYLLHEIHKCYYDQPVEVTYF